MPSAGLHLLSPLWFSLRNLEAKTVFRAAEPFSNAPGDPVCGWTKPEMPVDAWLPAAQRRDFHPEIWVGVLGIKWWNAQGDHAVEVAALPCVGYRASVILSWPALK